MFWQAPSSLNLRYCNAIHGIICRGRYRCRCRVRCEGGGSSGDKRFSAEQRRTSDDLLHFEMDRHSLQWLHLIISRNTQYHNYDEEVRVDGITIRRNYQSFTASSSTRMLSPPAAALAFVTSHSNSFKARSSLPTNSKACNPSMTPQVRLSVLNSINKKEP